jgi:hypothetical protein
MDVDSRRGIEPAAPIWNASAKLAVERIDTLEGMSRDIAKERERRRGDSLFESLEFDDTAGYPFLLPQTDAVLIGGRDFESYYVVGQDIESGGADLAWSLQPYREAGSDIRIGTIVLSFRNAFGYGNIAGRKRRDTTQTRSERKSAVFEKPLQLSGNFKGLFFERILVMPRFNIAEQGFIRVSGMNHFHRNLRRGGL